MHEIVLHGALKARYGGPFLLNVSTPVETIRALCSQLKGFEETIREGAYRLVRGDLKTGMQLCEDELLFNLGKAKEFHIVPVPAGAKRGGAGKIILGVALVGITLAAPGVGFAGAWNGATIGGIAGGVTYGSVVGGLGVSLILSGVSSLLTPTPQVQDYSQRERPDQRPSFLFNGPVNTAEQGLPVPLVYGQVRTGSVVVSAGITTDNI